MVGLNLAVKVRPIYSIVSTWVDEVWFRIVRAVAIGVTASNGPCQLNRESRKPTSQSNNKVLHKSFILPIVLSKLFWPGNIN